MGYLERIRAVAAERPDRVALTWPGGELSYRRLIEHVDTAAARLVRSGIGRGDRVGLRVPRCPGLAIGMLAISAAGAVIVPMSVDEAPERAHAIAADSGLRLIVWAGSAPPASVQGGGLELGQDGAPILTPPEVEQDAMDRSNGGSPAVTNEDGAYLLYTSGSTGVPKGVLVEHAALEAYLLWCARVFVDADAPIPVTASPAFDAVLKQVLAPLVSGAAVWMVGEETARSPHGLARLAADPAHPMTLNCVPSLWRAVLAEWPASANNAAGVRRLLLGGEPLSGDLLARTRELLPRLEIWNLYGPTEATANASAGQVDQPPALLGEPLPGVALHALGQDGVPVGRGQVGELYIGGSGVARCYQGRPAETAERFVPDPYSAMPGARMFRTGDLVRVAAPGRMEFQGRADRMIKRSGVRIELDEIEHALRRLPYVDDGAVLAGPGGDGGPQLTAVVAVAEPVALAASQVRHDLAARLPRAAIPDVVRVVLELPRTPAGKPDLAALRDTERLCEPDADQLGGAALTRTGTDRSGSDATEADDALTAIVAEIWADVLEHERVAADADFFELGGHSLAMIRIAGRVAERLGVELAVDVFYDAPTVKEFAAAFLSAPGGEEAARRARDLWDAQRRSQVEAVH